MNATKVALAPILGRLGWMFEAIAVPALVVVLVFVLRAVLHRFVLPKGASEEARTMWRRVSLYVTTIAAILLAWAVVSLRGDHLVQALAPIVNRPASEIRLFVRGMGNAIIATLVLLVLLQGIRQGHRRVLHLIDRWIDRARTPGTKKAALFKPQQLREALTVTARIVRALLIFILLYVYVPIILSAFPVTQPYALQVRPFVVVPLLQMGHAFVGYLPRLITLLLILVVVRTLLRLLRMWMSAVGRGDLEFKGFDPEWAAPTFKLLRVVAILITIVIVYPLLPGAGSEIFKGVSVFVGALVTLGGTSTIANVICGIVLTYSRSFRVGERVQIGDTLGDVMEKTLFVTRIRTPKNEHVTFPNSVVFGGRVVNHSAAAADGGMAVTVEAGIGYDVEWRKIHELMKAAAAKTEHVVGKPEPVVLQMELGDYAVKYLLFAWIDEAKRARVVGSEIRKHMLDLFAEADIEIMTPTVNALRNAPEPAYPQAQQQADPVQSALRFITNGPKGPVG